MILALPYFYRLHFNLLTLKLSSAYSVVALLRGSGSVTRLFFDFPYIAKSVSSGLTKTTTLTILHGQPQINDKVYLLRSIFNLVTSNYCYTSFRGLKLKGIGYKFVLPTSTFKHYIFLSAGLSHLIAYRLSLGAIALKLKKKKRLLILCAANLNRLTDDCRAIRNLSAPNVYSGKGLYFYHEKFHLKQGKKQSR